MLSVISEEVVKTFDTLAWPKKVDEDKIEGVLAMFDEPRTQIIYGRYRFNNGKQDGESITMYVTELRTIAKNVQRTELRPISFYKIDMCLEFAMTRSENDCYEPTT